MLGIWPDVRMRSLAGARRDSVLPFPCADPGCRTYARARQAIRAGVRALGLEPGDEVLVPAYHHGSEVEALLAAGLRCRFFDPEPDLEPPPDVLRSGRPVRALHLVHHLGFPQAGARWRRECDARGVLLLEDAAQAWLACDTDGPVGRHGDLAVFCLYKSVGVPDGAAAVVRAEVVQPERPGATGLRALGSPWARRLAIVTGHRRGPVAYDQAADIALAPEDVRPSRLTEHLLTRLQLEDVAERRRRNYRRLLDGCEELVAEPFRTLPPGASPFVFPVVVQDKAVALRLLRSRGVEGLDLWSRPHPALPGGDWPVSDYLRRHVVGLPAHHQLRDRDVEAVKAAAKLLEPPAVRLSAAAAAHR